MQAQQRGTGDAVNAARGALTGFTGAVLILYGDVPLLTVDTLKKLLAAYEPTKGAAGDDQLPPARSHRLRARAARRGTSGRGHRRAQGRHARSSALISEVNAGIYVADSKFLWGALERLTPQNAQGELYLTDIVAQAAQARRGGGGRSARPKRPPA